VGGVRARFMKLNALLNESVNHDMIVENVWVGGANGAKLVVSRGFGAILDLREEDNPRYRAFLRSHGVEYLNAKVPDRHGLSPETLSEIVEWLGDKTREDKKVLVHCNLGRGRSALAVAAYLVSQGVSPRDAVSKIKGKRSVTYMNKRQMQALLDYSEAVSHASGHDS
jgi:diacylglycerol kinase (ATP)